MEVGTLLAGVLGGGLTVGGTVYLGLKNLPIAKRQVGVAEKAQAAEEAQAVRTAQATEQDTLRDDQRELIATLKDLVPDYRALLVEYAAAVKSKAEIEVQVASLSAEVKAMAARIVEMETRMSTLLIERDDLRDAVAHVPALLETVRKQEEAIEGLTIENRHAKAMLETAGLAQAELAATVKAQDAELETYRAREPRPRTSTPTA